MIRFANVFKEYPRTGMALNDVSFLVGRGEFTFLTGPSGSGKSTILKLVYMDELPTRGAVWVGGAKAPGLKRSAIPQLRRKLGVVFQDFRLLDDRTVEQNVAFALEVVGTPREKIGPKVSRLLTRVGLASKATNHPRELSGGEQQRVAIARAIINEPKILLADEPTGNLDSKNSDIVLEMLRQLNKDLGQTIVMITHNPEAVTYFDRVVHMRDGVIVDGIPAD